MVDGRMALHKREERKRRQAFLWGITVGELASAHGFSAQCTAA